METMFDNVITRAVANVAAKLESLDAEALARVEATATLDMSEWLVLGPKASEAMLLGLVSTDAAQALHAIHTDFHNGASLAQRVVFLQAMVEIMQAQRG